MPSIPVGKCQCGCGQDTLIPTKTNKAYGDVKGQPRKFLRGHALIRRDLEAAGGLNPSGLCQCGCGERAPIARQTIYSTGMVRGQPLRFIIGHHSRTHLRSKREIPEPNPSGICQCGCGQRAPLAKHGNVTEGYVAGKPVRYCLGHQNRIAGSRHEVKDCGYSTPCWLWPDGKKPMRYGRQLRDGRAVLVYHIYYEEKYGPVPEGKILDHLCRIPACVNPDHLEPVTFAENVRRGRAAKLNWDKVREIHASDLPEKQLADQLGVGPLAISRVRRGVTWVDEAGVLALPAEGVMG